MNKFVTIAVGMAAIGETLVNALSGLGEKKRKIKTLQYCAATLSPPLPTGESSTTHIRAYRDQERIVDVSLGSFRRGVFSNTTFIEQAEPILVDIPLERGQGFKVGFSDSATYNTGSIIMQYEDLE